MHSSVLRFTTSNPFPIFYALAALSRFHTLPILTPRSVFLVRHPYSIKARRFSCFLQVSLLSLFCFLFSMCFLLSSPSLLPSLSLHTHRQAALSPFLLAPLTAPAEHLLLPFTTLFRRSLYLTLSQSCLWHYRGYLRLDRLRGGNTGESIESETEIETVAIKQN